MLTTDQIHALSPDDSSSKAAKGLLAPAKWQMLGSNEVAIWGACQGSGSKPYQVIIDVAGPTFKCTCPSRKFPCKHGLALYLLRAQTQSVFTMGTPPPWVTEWLTARIERGEKKAAPTEAKPADPAAAAKREAKRLERMTQGANDLERWMSDLVRHGMADLPGKPTSFWREAAARLIDAQASGLANAVMQMEALVHTGEGWTQRTLVHMGRTQLLIEAMGRLEALQEPLRNDVRTACGWALEKDEVMKKGERVEDSWIVQGVSYDENDRLWERRVWLQGVGARRDALLLDFAHGQRRYDQSFVAGTAIKAALVFFPAAYPLRALTVAPPMTVSSIVPEAAANWSDALESVALAMSGNPWLQRLPIVLQSVTPVRRAGRWFARDAESREVALKIAEDDGWQLLAISGGHPLRMFGEWLGDRLRPLTAWQLDAAEVKWTESIAA